MQLNYNFTPVLVKKVLFVAHKGKRRGFRHPSNVHPSKTHEIMYVDYGRLVLNLNEKSIRINPGECIFIPGGAWHSFAGEEGEPFDYMNIMFIGNPPQSLFGKKLNANRKCIELMEILKQESIQEIPYCREIMAGVLTELISRFLRQVEFSIPDKLPGSLNSNRYRSENVNRALKVISDEYSKPLTLKQLSRSAGIGESRLAQLLKIETGENFSSILHRQRITAAKHLISEGTFSLEEISNAVGYQSTSFFFKIFKRITGMTPKTYSKSLGDPTVRE